MPVIAVLCIVLSVPARVAAIRREIDLTGVGVGLSAWRTDADDARHFRVAARHAALFVDSRAPHVRVPLRARGPGRPAIDVALFLEGRLAGRLRVQSGAWSDLDMPLPPPGGHPRFLRLDLRWSSDARRARLDVGALAYPGDDGS